MKPIKLKSPAVNHFCDDNRQTRRTLKKYLEGALTTYDLYVSLLLQDLRKTAHGKEFQPHHIMLSFPTHILSTLDNRYVSCEGQITSLA